MGAVKSSLMEAEGGVWKVGDEQYERVFEMWKTISTLKDTTNDLIKEKIIVIENLVSEGNALVHDLHENQNKVEEETKELDILFKEREELEKKEELLKDAKDSLNERV